MKLETLKTIESALVDAIMAEAELEQSKRRYSTLKNLRKMTEDDAAKAAIAIRMSAEDERVGELWRWKLDLENACEEFTEKDWR